MFQLSQAPLELTSQLLSHLTTTRVHDIYFPYARFATLHAIRVSIIWASLTRRRTGSVSYLYDLFGYLVLAWGGSTIVALLTSNPPTWFSTTPWCIYPFIHFIFIYSPLPLAKIIIRIIPTPILDISGAYIDGITRGTTVSILTSLPFSSSTQSNSIWGKALLSGIAISGGGWIAQTLSLMSNQWELSTPLVLRNGAGILDTMDTWSAFFLSIFYSIVSSTDTTFISPNVDLFVRGFVPSNLAVTGKGLGLGLGKGEIAKSAVVVLMGSLLAGRVITRLVVPIAAQAQPQSQAQAQAQSGKRENIRDVQDIDTWDNSLTQKGRKNREGTPKKNNGSGKATPKKTG